MTLLTSIARREAGSPSARAPAGIALGIVLTIAPTFAFAETRVHGSPEAVVVEIQDATVEEILLALSDAFKFQFRSTANLNKRLNGTYQGTLQQAVSHILKGYDFVIKSGEAGLEVTLLSSENSAPLNGFRNPAPMVGSRTLTPMTVSPPAPAFPIR
jgi:hypothetical protein